MSIKSKNPLYVVTNNGQDVEEALNFIDMMLKKLGLEPVYQLLEGLIHEMLQQVNSYALFIAVKEALDSLVEIIERLIKKIDPVLAFSLFKK